ncbi:MAG: hypothetical protein ACLTNO_08010 [Blautia sp.]
MKAAIQKVGAHRIVMSTDWPGNDLMELLKIEIASDGDQETFRKIAGENMKRIMKL